MLQGKVDLAIAFRRAPSAIRCCASAQFLSRIRSIRLHQLKRKVTLRDLRADRHLLVRDSGSKRDGRALSMEVEPCWTVSTMATSILAAQLGH